MVFLHLVPTMGALRGCSPVCGPLHRRALQGCSIQAALAGLQVRVLKTLKTLNLIVFLHLVPTMGALWLLSSVQPLHLRALQGWAAHPGSACRCVGAGPHTQLWRRLGRQPTPSS